MFNLGSILHFASFPIEAVKHFTLKVTSKSTPLHTRPFFQPIRSILHPKIQKHQQLVLFFRSLKIHRIAQAWKKVNQKQQQNIFGKQDAR